MMEMLLGNDDGTLNDGNATHGYGSIYNGVSKANTVYMTAVGRSGLVYQLLACQQTVNCRNICKKYTVVQPQVNVPDARIMDEFLGFHRRLENACS